MLPKALRRRRFIGHILQELLSSYDDLKVVGTASDPFVAREKIKQLRPDVLTLDIEMPRMNGLEFLERLMRLRPMPVVMVSSLTEKHAETTLRALELGAVDYIAKPKVGAEQSLAEYGEELANKIRAAAATDVSYIQSLDKTWWSGLLSDPKRGLPEWQDHIYIALAHSAASATDFYRIPHDRVVELGIQITV